MTGKERHENDDRLARLYREQSDIEPGPGVDQHIRARAHEDARPGRLRRPSQWLGGVAVAASLFVVVSVVTNIQPPEAELPSEAVQQDFSPAGASAPEPQAGEAEMRPLRERAEPAIMQDRAAPVPSSPSALERRERTTPADDADRSSQRQSEGLFELPMREEGQREEEAGFRMSSRAALDVEGERKAAADEALQRIEHLISQGDAERARAEIKDFERRFPEHAVPPELISRIESIEQDGPPN